MATDCIVHPCILQAWECAAQLNSPWTSHTERQYLLLGVYPQGDREWASCMNIAPSPSWSCGWLNIQICLKVGSHSWLGTLLGEKIRDVETIQGRMHSALRPNPYLSWGDKYPATILTKHLIICCFGGSFPFPQHCASLGIHIIFLSVNSNSMEQDWLCPLQKQHFLCPVSQIPTNKNKWISKLDFFSINFAQYAGLFLNTVLERYFPTPSVSFKTTGSGSHSELTWTHVIVADLEKVVGSLARRSDLWFYRSPLKYQNNILIP